MDCHLVSVKVGIESSTCERMQLDSFALNQLRLESLNTKTVKRRGTVEQYRMTLHHILENIPDDWLTAVNNLLSTLYCLNYAAFYQLADNEGLVKFGCHKFRQATLSHLQFWTYDNYRTGRIVDTLTKEVLTETSLFSFQ